MLPADGIHGFGGVQAAFYAYVALTIAGTLAAWWLGLPTNLTVVAFPAIVGALLVPFRSVFTERHPEHAEA